MEVNAKFKEALDNGIVEPVLFEGKPWVLDDIPFYQFAGEGTKMSAGRFYAMADMQRDHDELKLDGSTLDIAISVIKKSIDTALRSIDLDTINEALMLAKLHVTTLEQRRKYDLSIERTYDNATAWHFSCDENPLIYDAEKAHRNKMVWLKYPETLDFFLTQPIGKHVNWRQLYDYDGLNYLKNQLTMELSILEATLQSLKRIDSTNGLYSSLKSRKETLHALIGFLTARLKITSTISQHTSQLKKQPKPQTKKRRK